MGTSFLNVLPENVGYGAKKSGCSVAMRSNASIGNLKRTLLTCFRSSEPGHKPPPNSSISSTRGPRSLILSPVNIDFTSSVRSRMSLQFWPELYTQHEKTLAFRRCPRRNHWNPRFPISFILNTDQTGFDLHLILLPNINLKTSSRTTTFTFPCHLPIRK